MSILIEPIKNEFGVSDAMMGLLTGLAFALFYTLLGVPVARFADRGDRKLVIVVSVMVWSLMTVLCGMARSFPQLFLARIGVGAGEAGAMPPAQSLIADYFPPEQRGRALSVFLTASAAGYLAAFILGAQIADHYGWRMAFLSLGLPGLLLGIVAWFSLPEPRKQGFGRPIVAPTSETFRASCSILFKKRSFVFLCVALICYNLVAYGVLSWLPAYLVRVMRLELSQVGTVYGPVIASSGILGTILGGVVTDYVGKLDLKSPARILAGALAGTTIIYEAALYSQSLTIFYVLTFFGATAMAAALPAVFVILHRICGDRRRATSVALLMLLGNLFGLGLGPLLTGAASDAFTSHFGVEGLRYALMSSLLFLIPAGLALWKVSATIEVEAEA